MEKKLELFEALLADIAVSAQIIAEVLCDVYGYDVVECDGECEAEEKVADEAAEAV
jgi:hypothetical protein